MDAPLGSGEFVEWDELERLRRRAYGPDADIAGMRRRKVASRNWRPADADR
jgi:hypothetical protein